MPMSLSSPCFGIAAIQIPCACQKHKKGVGVALMLWSRPHVRLCVSLFCFPQHAHTGPANRAAAQNIPSPHKQHQTHHKTKAQQQASLIRTGTMLDAKEAWQVRSARAASLSRPPLSVLSVLPPPFPSTCLFLAPHSHLTSPFSLPLFHPLL